MILRHLAPKHRNRPVVSSRRGQPADVERLEAAFGVAKIIAASCELSDVTTEHSQTLKPVGESLC